MTGTPACSRVLIPLEEGPSLLEEQVWRGVKSSGALVPLVKSCTDGGIRPMRAPGSSNTLGIAVCMEGTPEMVKYVYMGASEYGSVW